MDLVGESDVLKAFVWLSGKRILSYMTWKIKGRIIEKKIKFMS